MAQQTFDAAFKGVGQKQGLKIWRIENMQVVAIPERDYGYFFEGDSYILLHTKLSSGGKSWNIHFWLGKSTSQDEAGVAAIKTVELDDHLGGGPVQHREVQEHESQLFLSYFKKGINYKPGGIKSGFKHVDRDAHEKRLLKVKGKRNIRVNQMPSIGWDQLNKGDVFILDLGQKIVQWNGSESNRFERMKGLEAARRIRDDERGGRAHVIVIEENDKNLDADFLKEMGDKQNVASASAGGDDAKFDRNNAALLKLYRMSDASGTLELTEISERPLTQDLLDSKDCFIIDQGPSGIFVWKGKGATKQEKNGAFKNAMGFIKAKKYPNHTPVTSVIEYAEPANFKALFKGWADKGTVHGVGSVYTTGRVAKMSNQKFDAAALHAHPQMAAEQKMVDDGTGKVEVWRVENFDLVPLDKSFYGHFFGGDCYVILYTYKVNGRENYIIYYWQGLESTSDEKGTSALKAVEIDDKLGGQPVQIRQVMGKECNHFLSMFRGKMIIYKGGKASGFKNAEEAKSASSTQCRLFHVRGTSEISTKAIEVTPRAASLNSNDTFVVKTPQSTFLWCGKGCSGDERELAKSVAKTISQRDYVIVPEGQEPNEFWTALGGKSPYANTPRMAEQLAPHPTRLFQCSNASGRFRVEEVPEFTQEDLVEDDVMLLDTWDEVFIWVGKGANATEKKESVNTASEYIRTDPSGRDEDTPLLQVKQGFEPPTFTGWFQAWDPYRWSEGKSYNQLKAEIGEQNAAVTIVSADANGGSGSSDNPGDFPKHPYESLLGEDLPEGVNPTKKEFYLSDADFAQVFGMDWNAFQQLAKWKRDNLKKKAKIF